MKSLKYILSFNIVGDPISKKRHRSTTNKGQSFSRNYNPSSEDELNFKADVMEIVGCVGPIVGPIEIKCVYSFKRPKSHYGTGRNEFILKKSAPKYYTKKPDIDNLDKFLFDALTGYLWLDDKQIVISDSIKKYSDHSNGGTYVDIYYQKQEV